MAIGNEVKVTWIGELFEYIVKDGLLVVFDLDEGLGRIGKHLGWRYRLLKAIVDPRTSIALQRRGETRKMMRAINSTGEEKSKEEEGAELPPAASTCIYEISSLDG